MFCKNCGKYLDDNMYYCDNCSAPTEKQTQWSPFGANPNQNPYSSQNNSYDNNFNNKQFYEIDKKIDDSRTMGILAIVLGFCVSSIVGIVLGAIGLSKLNEIPFEFSNYNQQKIQKAKTLNIVGIVVPLVVRIIIYIVYFAFIFSMISFAY